jgi:hypothetical protein
VAVASKRPTKKWHSALRRVCLGSIQSGQASHAARAAKGSPNTVEFI